MRLMAVGVGMVVLAQALSGCGGGDGSLTATPTESDFDRSTAYFNRLGTSLQATEPEPAAEDEETTPTPGVPPTPNATATNAATVSVLQALVAELERLTPPPAAAEAHQALLEATRDLIDASTDQTTGTPVNEATAQAEASDAVVRYAEACTELARLAQEADAPVNLPCAIASEPEPTQAPELTPEG